MENRSVPRPHLLATRDPCPELPVERGTENRGVGSWVAHGKHKLLADYLYASRFAWRRFGNRILIDPFCGPGRIQVRRESQTREGGAVLACRTLATTAPFTKVLIGDIDPQRAAACEARLRAEDFPAKTFVGPAADTIHAMVSEVPRRSLCLAYIDPYNLEYLDFAILQALNELPKVDLAINFSVMDLTRNADNEMDPDRARFDKAAPGWREHVQDAEISRSGLPLALFRYWLKLVGDLGFMHSEAMPLVTNDRGGELYRMVFLSRHAFPDRIWRDVARGPNRDLFD